MKVLNDEKNMVLLSALEERYRSIHIIRDRVYNFSLWTLGILLGSAGWLFQSSIHLCVYEKVGIIFLLFISSTILKLFYLDNLQKGFKSQRDIASKLESLLGFYDEENPIYPLSWKTVKEGNFFKNNIIIILLGVFILTFTIIFFT